MRVQFPSLSPMLIEFDQILNLKNEAEQRMVQRDFSGQNPKLALCEAENKIARYKDEWDNSSEKPRATEFNNARRLKNSLKPILGELELTKQKLIERISDELDLDRKRFADNEILATEAILNIDRFPPEKVNPDIPLIISNISGGLRQYGKVQLLMFSCPEIDANLLTTPYPDMYIRTVAGINTGTADPRPLNKLTKILSALEIPSELEIIVGELDEENYIFPILGDFGIDKQTLQQNRAAYLVSFREQASVTFPDTNVNVFGWSEFSQEISVNDNLPSFRYLDEEINRMEMLFKNGRYYSGLPNPSPDQLFKISMLKMRTYAKQGKTLKEIFPFAIGIQNEFPARLRTLMLNAELLACRNEPIPMIYPFNERESLY